MPIIECKSIVEEDTNGGALKPKKGQIAHLVTQSPDNKFIEGLIDAVRAGVVPQTFSQRFREILSRCFPERPNYYPHGTEFRQGLKDWQPLPPDYPITNWEKVQSKLLFNHAQFFDRYDFSTEEVANLQRAHELGASISLNTGIPYPARARYKPVVEFVGRELLHPELGVILNPDLRHISGVHTKLAMAVIGGNATIVEGFTLEEFYQDDPQLLVEGGGVDLYPRDDDLAVLSWLSYLLGIKTYLSVSMEEARQQKHKSKVEIPRFTDAMIKTGRVPTPDPNMSIMLADIANHRFHNHPILRVGRLPGRSPIFRNTA